MTEWVLDTISQFASLPFNLVIKPHPGETRNFSRRTLYDEIHSNFSNIPKNVTLIPSNLNISPYSLFPITDIGLVYNGTVGLEMLLSGISVIACAKSPYSWLSSCNFPSTLSQYHSFLSSFTSLATIDPSEVELFAYFHFVKNQIPWTLTERAFGDKIPLFDPSLRYTRSDSVQHLLDVITNQCPCPEYW